jgi:CRP-like cAMP-binding protein
VSSGPAPSTFLERLDEDDRQALLSLGLRRKFAGGSALLHQRQVPERVLVLLSGRVKIAAVTDEGREAIVAVRGPGELIGERSVFDGRPHGATVTALEPVEALTVDAESFRGFVSGRPKVSLLLLGMLAERLRETDRHLTEFTRYDTTGRVAARIIQLAERYGEAEPDGAVRIDLPITQEELAAWTGASREAVGKALATLRECGWIETGRRRLVIRDVAAVRQLLSNR